MLFGRLSILCLILLLSACALAPPAPTQPEALRCLDVYKALDQAVAGYGVTPSSPRRIQGFPYLRVDRFLASYRNQPLEPAEREAWLNRLAALEREARQIELDSLPHPVLAELSKRFATRSTLSAALATCSQTLQSYDLSSPVRLNAIAQRATVPDDYHTLNQVLGLYPLTVLPVSYGIFRWQEETRQLFNLPLQALPVTGKLERFRPPEEPLAWSRFSLYTRDALGIPLLDSTQLNALFAAHAPVWEIDIAGDFDRPGTPYWRANGVPTVDPDNPVIYRYTSYTHWQGRSLLQLNYLIWFSERPRTSAWDILGGALDGVIWRVTLDERSKPLLYDSIHACGCYHLYFPTPALRLRSQALSWAEPPLALQTASSLATGKRMIVRVASGSHYIQRVYMDYSTGRAYAWRDYRTLYAVPIADGGTRSLFSPDGLVAGTERGERWLLWPMGVPSPGAMRERGRHATAFVGRQHFDDPDLVQQVFALSEPSH